MQTCFSTLQSLETFTQSLTDQEVCAFCAQSDQWDHFEHTAQFPHHNPCSNYYANHSPDHNTAPENAD